METPRDTCRKCGREIWLYRGTDGEHWQHSGGLPWPNLHTAEPGTYVETNFTPDAEAERADEISKELRFGPLEDPPEDDFAHGVAPERLVS
jgi:hypothetical protein